MITMMNGRNKFDMMNMNMINPPVYSMCEYDENVTSS